MAGKTRKTAFKLVAFALIMFGFGFGLVPLYDVICEVTGLNGKTGSITENQANAGRVDENRLVEVQFIANLNQSMNWTFTPATQKMTVKPGEIYEVDYLVNNHNASPTTGRAVPSVAPAAAAAFFNKIECFCFTEQRLEPGEERMMPLRFVVNADLPEHISTISLSYTFFDITKNTRENKS